MLIILSKLFRITVINIEVIEINTSFLTIFFKILISIIVLCFIKKVFDIEEVFFFFIFFSNDIDIYCKKLLAIILCLSIIVPKIFLIILILFIGLIDKRLLLFTSYIGGKNINGGILCK